MTARPILFSAPMVRALLGGSKTQTRRVAKNPFMYLPPRCPCGQPGDRLVVREAWRTVSEADYMPPRDLTKAHRIWYEANTPHQPGFGRYRPGMFMPRWASRITLEIVSVRVERLQAISEADAIAEGVEPLPHHPGRWWINGGNLNYPTALAAYRDLWESINTRPKLPANTASKRYARVKKWLDTHPGEKSWDANPWVWVVEFRRLP